MKTGDIFRLNLRQIREAKGFTQKSLAEKVGLNDQAIREYEAGRRFPPVETLGQIATELGINVSQLFESDEAAPVLAMPVSKTLQKLLVIPDSFYDAINGVSSKNEVWGIIEGLLRVASEHERENSGESKDA